MCQTLFVSYPLKQLRLERLHARRRDRKEVELHEIPFRFKAKDRISEFGMRCQA